LGDWFLGKIIEIYRCIPIFWATFFNGKRFVLISTKNGLGYIHIGQFSRQLTCSPWRESKFFGIERFERKSQKELKPLRLQRNRIRMNELLKFNSFFSRVIFLCNFSAQFFFVIFLASVGSRKSVVTYDIVILFIEKQCVQICLHRANNIVRHFLNVKIT
jgi:hypothetical protein